MRQKILKNIICPTCSTCFSSKFKNAVYCSLQCSKLGIAKVLSDRARVKQEIAEAKYLCSPRLCSKCNEIIAFKTSRDPKALFCSRSCAVSVNNLTPKRKKVEKASQQIADAKQAYRSKIKCTRICVVCNQNFASSSFVRLTCSDECYKKYLSIKVRENPNCGGHTKRTYPYNGVILDSSWEVRVAESLDENSIVWSRPSTFRLLNRRRYTPDFFLPEYGLYLDPKAFRKGYVTQCKKIKQFEFEYHTVCLVLGQYELSWPAIETRIAQATYDPES